MVSREGIDLKDLKSMPKPKLECRVTFDFEKNHSKKEIEKILNKECLFSVTKDEAELDFEMHKNNFADKTLASEKVTGYICFDFGNVEDFDGQKIVTNAVNFLYNKKDKIIALNESLGGTITICLSVFLTSFNSPYVTMDHQTIKRMAELNIMFDESVDFYSYLDFKNTINKLEYEE